MHAKLHQPKEMKFEEDYETPDIFFYSMGEREVKLIHLRFLSQYPWTRFELKGSEAGKGLGSISDALESGWEAHGQGDVRHWCPTLVFVAMRKNCDQN